MIKKAWLKDDQLDNICWRKDPALQKIEVPQYFITASAQRQLLVRKLVEDAEVQDEIDKKLFFRERNLLTARKDMKSNQYSKRLPTVPLYAASTFVTQSQSASMTQLPSKRPVSSNPKVISNYYEQLLGTNYQPQCPNRQLELQDLTNSLSFTQRPQTHTQMHQTRPQTSKERPQTGKVKSAVQRPMSVVERGRDQLKFSIQIKNISKFQ
ncbi:Hypothetical_protein [Hexamita inflata]|uniref:Hypothetical_protein n=1 Tax=Hexamita inflata TaxID=28002 RepID=A0AA86N9X2_9EUKA|nr:Hypothetical protein HINF_LOCUS3477 [Hexamita inflata]